MRTQTWNHSAFATPTLGFTNIIPYASIVQKGTLEQSSTQFSFRSYEITDQGKRVVAITNSRFLVTQSICGLDPRRRSGTDDVI